MPSRFVLQPNGLLARFSSVVDDFTHTNLTREEALEVAREGLGIREAEEKVERGLKDELPRRHGVYGDGTARWKESLDIIKAIHGRKAAKEAETECSVKPEEVER